MGGEPCLIRGRIVAFDQDRFVRLHLRYVEPAMGGVVSDAVDLAGSIAIDQIGGDKIREGDGRRVADGERCIAQRPADRTPEIDHLHAALEQMFRLVAKQIAHPLRPGLRGMVDMDARRRLPRRAGGAAVGAGNALPPRVIEDEDA